MPAMFPLGKMIAVPVACVALLFIVIGIATPLQTMPAGSDECDLGIKEMDCSGTVTDAWDYECDALSGDAKDNCASGQAQLKAGFAFCFLGMLTNVVLILSYVSANGWLSLAVPLLGKQMPSAGIGGVTILLYLIGVCCALSAYPTFFDHFDSEIDISIGGAMLILGLILIAAATGLGFVGMDDAAESTSTPVIVLGAVPSP